MSRTSSERLTYVQFTSCVYWVVWFVNNTKARKLLSKCSGWDSLRGKQLWLILGWQEKEFTHKLKDGGMVNLTPHCSFSKNVSSRKGVKPWFFVTFNIKSYLSWNFIEIPQIVPKIWRFSPSILTIFFNFSDFLTFPCYKETNYVSI